MKNNSSKSYFVLLLLLSYIFSFFLQANEMRKKIIISSYIKGINLAQAYGEIVFDKEVFSLKLEANTVGIFSLLSNWSQTILSEGNYRDKKLVSKIYKSDDSRGNKNGHMYIDYSYEIPKIISAQPDPRKDDRREKIKNIDLYKTMDPFAGIVNIGIGGNCKPSIEIFDGKRKYIIKTEKINKDKIIADSFFEDDFQALKCKFYIQKVAGYTNKEKGRYPSEGFIWIRKFKDYKTYFPVKIMIDTKWGSFISLIKERRNTSESNSL